MGKNGETYGLRQLQNELHTLSSPAQVDVFAGKDLLQTQQSEVSFRDSLEGGGKGGCIFLFSFSHHSGTGLLSHFHTLLLQAVCVVVILSWIAQVCAVSAFVQLEVHRLQFSFHISWILFAVFVVGAWDLSPPCMVKVKMLCFAFFCNFCSFEYMC